MPVQFTENEKQLFLSEAAYFTKEEQALVLRMVEGSYADDAAKVSYDAELRPYIDQWVDKVKDSKGYRAQMWVVKTLTGFVQNIVAQFHGKHAVSAISDYTKAMEELQPAFAAAKQKIDSDPKGAVDDMVAAFDKFHDVRSGYFSRLASLYPAGYLTTFVQLATPFSGLMYGATAAAGWLAYKRLMHKAIKEAKKLQQKQPGAEPAFTQDLQSWSDRKRGEDAKPVSPSVREEFTRMFGGDEAQSSPAPLTQKTTKTRKRQPEIPSTTRPVEPPSSSGSGFSFDPKVLRRLLSGA